MKRQSIRILMFVGFGLFFTGCGPAFRVEVSSIDSAFAITKKNYILLPAVENIDENDLQFKEYAAYIHRALEQKGFKQASGEAANLVVFVTYGIGAPITQYYAYSLPIYGQVGGGTSHFDATAFGSGGSSFISGSVYSLPQYGVVGSQSYSGSYLTYPRYVILGAYDADRLRQSEGKDAVQAWRTVITSMGKSGDLRRVLPVMLAAGYEHIGTNTKQKIDITLTENDKRVQLIKGLIDLPKVGETNP